MESAALYTLAQVRDFPILCLAHVTNTMATDGDDFEKGEAQGSKDALALVAAIAENLSEILDSFPRASDAN